MYVKFLFFQIAEPGWLVELRNGHRDALEPMDNQLKSLNVELESVKVDINEVIQEIQVAEGRKTMAEHSKKQAEHQIEQAEFEIQQAELRRQHAEYDREQAELGKKTAEHDIGIAADKKMVAETIKGKSEERSAKLLLAIDRTRALRVQTNQYWLDLINERLRQHHIHSRR